MSWPEVALGEVAAFRSGGTPDRQNTDYWGGEIPWVTGADFDQGTLRIGRSAVTEAGLNNSAATTVAAGTVLLVTRTGVGKVAVAPQELSFSQDITAVLPDVQRLVPDYLRRYLAASSGYLASRARGATIRGVTRDVVRSMRIPIRPLGEQRRTAQSLEIALQAVAARSESLQDASAFEAALFAVLFGDPLTNPKRWPTGELQELGRIDRGVSRHRPRNAPELLGGPHPLIQTGDVAQAGRVITTYSASYSDAGLAQSKMWPAGTLCITIAANIADTGILGFDACFPDSVVGFVADEPTTEYVRVLLSLRQQAIEQAATKSAQKNINLKVLRKMRVPVPPPELRDRFLTAVSEIDRIRDGAAVHLAHLNELFASLQHRAFAGQL